MDTNDIKRVQESFAKVAPIADTAASWTKAYGTLATVMIAAIHSETAQ